MRNRLSSALRMHSDVSGGDDMLRWLLQFWASYIYIYEYNLCFHKMFNHTALNFQAMWEMIICVCTEQRRWVCVNEANHLLRITSWAIWKSGDTKIEACRILWARLKIGTQNEWVERMEARKHTFEKWYARNEPSTLILICTFNRRFCQWTKVIWMKIPTCSSSRISQSSPPI